MAPELRGAGGFHLAGRVRSFYYAARGVSVMLRTQHNAWIHAVATVAVGMAGVSLDISREEWFFVLLAAASVWTAEALNTAFESLCDVASPEIHPLVERAKDVAAGAVLITALAAATIGVFIFAPRLEWVLWTG